MYLDPEIYSNKSRISVSIEHDERIQHRTLEIWV